MDGRIVLILTLAVALSSKCSALSISKRSADACPAIDACLSPAQMILDLVTKDDIKTLHTLSYPGLLDHVCGQKPAITSCLESTYCNVYEASYNGVAVVAVMEHICDVARDDFLSEANCFGRDSAYNAVQLCSKNMLVGFDVYSAAIDTGHAQPVGFCKVLDAFLQCVHSGIEHACTTRAADLMTTTFRATVMPMTTRVRCTLAST